MLHQTHSLLRTRGGTALELSHLLIDQIVSADLRHLETVAPTSQREFELG